MSAEVENKNVTEEKPPAEETKKSTEEPVVEKKEEEKSEKETEKESSKKEKKDKEEPAEPTPPPPRVHKTDFQKDVVYLYQFCRTPVLPSLSPYCLKVETWLRLQGIKYENVDHKIKLKSSKGQLPFVELNGEEIADSAVIITKLGQHFGADLDANLSKDDKNKAHALISMIENHLCWVYVYWRSKFPDAMIKGCKLNLQHALGSRMPNALLNIVFKLTYSRKGAKKVKAHGLGVHSPEEVLQLGKDDLTVLEEMLGDKEFFFGDKPSNLDVVVFAHVSQIAYVDKSVDYDLREFFLEKCPNLNGLLTRIKERAFPDWEDITTTLGLNTHLPKPEPEEKKDAEKDTKEKEGKETEKESEVIKDDGKEKDEKEEPKKETEEAKS